MTVLWREDTDVRGATAVPDERVGSGDDLRPGPRTAQSERTAPCPACPPRGRPPRQGLGRDLEQRLPDAVATEPSTRAVPDAVNLGKVSVVMDSDAWTAFSCDEPQFGHSHPILRLLMVLDGQVRLQVGDQHYTVGPNGGLLINGRTPYAFQAADETTYLRVDLDADFPALRGVAAEPYAWPDDSLLVAATSSFLVQAIRSVRESPALAPREPFVALERITVALLHAMILRGRPNCESDRQDARERVIEYISCNSADPSLRPESIARAMGTSTRTLQRLFKGDMSVADHIRSARLENALRLLNDHQSPLTLAAIARRCGFKSSTTLRRAVYNATGVLPSEYRTL